MVRIQEHEARMLDIKKQVEHSHGHQRQQLLKHYHRMKKELNQCRIYIKQNGGEKSR